MIYPAFDTNFSNQGVQMKVKETEILNNKIHTPVYIHPFWGEVKAFIL